jgi:hypothetical protein
MTDPTILAGILHEVRRDRITLAAGTSITIPSGLSTQDVPVGSTDGDAQRARRVGGEGDRTRTATEWAGEDLMVGLDLHAWFYSSLAQVSAAIMGIIGAVFLTRLTNHLQLTRDQFDETQRQLDQDHANLATHVSWFTDDPTLKMKPGAADRPPDTGYDSRALQDSHGDGEREADQTGAG